MTRLKGIKVTLIRREQTGLDPFHDPIYTDVEEAVDNVLVAPVASGGAELLDTVTLEGRKAVYQLAIPKGDTHTWEGQRVRFFGNVWRVVGKPTLGIEELIPLDWNKIVKVEAANVEESKSDA